MRGAHRGCVKLQVSCIMLIDTCTHFSHLCSIITQQNSSIVANVNILKLDLVVDTWMNTGMYKYFVVCCFYLFHIFTTVLLLILSCHFWRQLNTVLPHLVSQSRFVISHCICRSMLWKIRQFSFSCHANETHTVHFVF